MINFNLPKYLFLDTETSGIDPLNSELLTAAFILYDAAGVKELARLSLKCKPSSGIFRVTPRAMEVNKINLSSHELSALSYNSCQEVLFNWLRDKAGGNKLTIIGHRTDFDLGFLKTHLFDLLSLKSHISRRYEDTSVIASFLGIQFKDLKDLSVQLRIPSIDLVMHTAEGDAELTARCYFKMQEMVLGE